MRTTVAGWDSKFLRRRKEPRASRRPLMSGSGSEKQIERLSSKGNLPQTQRRRYPPPCLQSYVGSCITKSYCCLTKSKAARALPTYTRCSPFGLYPTSLSTTLQVKSFSQPFWTKEPRQVRAFSHSKNISAQHKGKTLNWYLYTGDRGDILVEILNFTN